MSIICQNENGWVICHKKFLNETYSCCLDSSTRNVSLAIKDIFFDINTPILMNSQAAKFAKSCDQDDKSKIKVKQKRKKLLKNEPHHNEVVTIIKQRVKQLLEDAKSLGHFRKDAISPLEWLENNSPARNAAKEILGVDNLSQKPFVTMKGDNCQSQPVIYSFQHEVYAIPPHSVFFQSNITDLGSVIDNDYDLILIDVPWENKSVRRKKGYASVKCEDLLSLPISKITRSNSIVCMWATNNEAQINFIKNNLFSHWGLQHCSDWHWVKVTTRGNFIYPIDSPHKKPYENLIIGCVKSDEEGTPVFEPNKVIISIPSSIHSHKPPLSEVFKPYLPKEAKCLELFARYLIPNWTSYGNEVLKLQNLKIFDQVEIDQATSKVIDG